MCPVRGTSTFSYMTWECIVIASTCSRCMSWGRKCSHLNFSFQQAIVEGTRLCRWLIQYATSGHVTGSILDEIDFFDWYKSFSRTMALGLTQPLTEMNARNIPGRGGGGMRCRRLKMTIWPPSLSRFSRKCEILHVSQPYRPPRPVTGIALLYRDGMCFLCGTNWTVSTATSSQYLVVNCEPIV
jgi:hypothetical protein